MPININEIPLTDIKVEDVVRIQNLHYYVTSSEEVTELTEKFADNLMTVEHISEEVNEWGEHAYICRNALGICTFTDHEFAKAYRIEVIN